jgi:hypothetical protein
MVRDEWLPPSKRLVTLPATEMTVRDALASIDREGDLALCAEGSAGDRTFHANIRNQSLLQAIAHISSTTHLAVAAHAGGIALTAGDTVATTWDTDGPVLALLGLPVNVVASGESRKGLAIALLAYPSEVRDIVLSECIVKTKSGSEYAVAMTAEERAPTMWEWLGVFRPGTVKDVSEVMCRASVTMRDAFCRVTVPMESGTYDLGDGTTLLLAKADKDKWNGDNTELQPVFEFAVTRAAQVTDAELARLKEAARREATGLPLDPSERAWASATLLRLPTISIVTMVSRNAQGKRVTPFMYRVRPTLPVEVRGEILRNPREIAAEQLDIIYASSWNRTDVEFRLKIVP